MSDQIFMFQAKPAPLPSALNPAKIKEPMKTLLFALLLLLIAFVGASAYREFTTPPALPREVTAPSAGNSTVSAAAIATPPNLPASRPITVAPKTIHTAAGNPQPNDGRTVEFRVESGLAVAYGDVVLGRVEPGTTSAKGYFEPPPPQLWDKPEIPYLISPELPDPSRVERAVQYFNQHTPVAFVARTDQRDAIVFEPGPEHCFSSLGRTGGLQPVSLAKGCQTQEILHEMMHALGFVHEQSRTDRDTYVQVLWDNIEEKYRPQFAIVPEPLMEAMRGSPFDYRSIMLYRPDTFALKPGMMSMQPTGPGAIDPVHEGLSEIDLQRLKRLFRL